jgi:RND family efflux transporter MFP subunit
VDESARGGVLKTAGFCFWVCSFFLFFPLAWAQAQSNQEKPPAPVVVAEVERGRVTPETQFIGTVYYPEVSEVASEVEGKVNVVRFEEGQRVKRGRLLVELDSQILEKNLAAARAGYQEVLANLENAKLEFQRIENLYQKGSLAPQSRDDQMFKVRGLKRKAEGLKAVMEKLQVERQKKSVEAPFEGIVVERKVDRGEWVSAGSAIASIARYDLVDIEVNVPQSVVKIIEAGMEVEVSVGGREAEGRIFASVPKGDVATRTFPVKIRMENSLSLIEGMEARARLPSGEPLEAFVVHRDAVINQYGKTVLFAVVDSMAKMIPVDVVGYEGLMAGVLAKSLEEGMQAVIKGNERLREGQKVNVMEVWSEAGQDKGIED